MTQTATLSPRDREKFVLAHPGLMMRVAKKCEVSHSLVSRVLRGLNTSARVSHGIDAEIRNEMRRDERQHERWKAKLAANAPVVAPAPVVDPNEEAAVA